MEQEDSDVAVVGTKGQIVIAQRFRKELAMTGLLVRDLYTFDMMEVD